MHIVDVNVLDILVENDTARNDFVVEAFRCVSVPPAVAAPLHDGNGTGALAAL